MRKRDELTDPLSCMSRAKPNELTFVLLGRDVCAPDTIRHWCRSRCRAGKNVWGDAQIREAMECARNMELEMAASVVPGRQAGAEGRAD